MFGFFIRWQKNINGPRIHTIADILQTHCLAQSFLQSLGQKLLIIYANTPLLNVNKEKEQ